MSNSSPLESIFFAALGKQSSAERVALLDEACAGNDELRGRVERMLTAQAEVGNFLEIPASPPDVTSDHPLREGPGSVIGPYKLLEQIGEGGMGVVFMAEQTRPVQRRVALKIIKAGMDTRQVVARFEAERQALAMMDHPNIARVLDAGATDTGRPYFVMELVRGVPITEFCNQQSLSIPDRLALFVTVCQAMQHAHQKGIIHRDIKPTNVLVTLHDGRPMIKVIDFGVAKATGQKLTDKTLFTGFTQMIGTPLYMSPEQAEMTSQDIDTRSDIFSAGVLLYELLTGTTPFDSQRLKSASFDELRRIIREEEPPRPSTRLTTLALEAASTVGTQRKSDPRHLSRLFRSELDWIVMKCLEKDRTRRYETASALAGDVERYLHDEPVQACPPSARYRFGKFARRNKAALTTVAAVMGALVLGTIVSTWQAVRAYTAEAEANTKQRASDAFQELFYNATSSDVYSSTDPKHSGRTVTVAEALDHATKELRNKFADDPRTKASLLEVIGRSYCRLEMFREAIPLFEQAREFRISISGRDDPGALRAMVDLARSYRMVGRFDEAVRLSDESLKLNTLTLGPDHPLTLESMESLAYCYADVGRLDKAVPLMEKTLKLTKAKLGPDHRDTLSLTRELAELCNAAGRFDEAVRLGEEALKLRKDRLGPDHIDTHESMGFLVRFYRDAGRLDEAIHLGEETLKLRIPKYGPDHPYTLNLMCDLATSYTAAGRFDEAVRLGEETLKLMKPKLGSDDIRAIEWMFSVACVYRDVGRFEDALKLQEESLKISKAELGPDNPITLWSMRNLAGGYNACGRHDEAIALAEEAVQRLKAKLGPDHPITLGAMCDLGRYYLDADRPDKALPLLEETLNFSKTKLSPEHATPLGAMNALAEAYLRVNRFAEAEILARESLAIREKKRPDDWWTFDTRSLLGESLLGQKKYTEAEPLLVSGCGGMHDRAAKIPARERPRLKDAIERLVKLYGATNQPEMIAVWKAKLTEFDKAAAKPTRSVPKDGVPHFEKSAKEPSASSPQH